MATSAAILAITVVSEHELRDRGYFRARLSLANGDFIEVSDYNLVLLEDAAESLGSHSQGRYTGTFGRLGVLSFNGNKIITTGGGGAILTDDE